MLAKVPPTTPDIGGYGNSDSSNFGVLDPPFRPLRAWSSIVYESQALVAFYGQKGSIIVLD